MNYFLHKKSDGTYTYIYYDLKNSSMSIRRYGKKGIKGNSTVLRTNVERGFSCSADKNGNLHIVFSIVNGGIHYGYFTDTSFHSYQILSAKSPMNYNKNLMISASSNPVCVFYTIRHNNKTILSMQSVNCNDNTSSSPIAIDYVISSDTADISIGMCENLTDNILLAYCKESSERNANIIREVSREGKSLKTREYFSNINIPLNVDMLYFEDETAKLLCHDDRHIYIVSIDSKISVDEIELDPQTRNSNTFYGLISLYNKLYCYMCTDGILYTCILRGGSQSLDMEKQPRQYSGNIVPVNCFIDGMTPQKLTVPGNLSTSQFFYIFNPFSESKNIEEAMDISRVISIEKRLSALEKQLEKCLIYIRDIEEKK